jgi:exodeoxyribonuclease VII large subunit
LWLLSTDVKFIDMERKTYGLSEVLEMVKGKLEEAFPRSLWIRAEISELKVNQKGHCYLELAEVQNGSQVAHVRATIWRSKWALLEPYFRSVTGTTLQAGMKVLVRAEISFHAIYGFSLSIDDIDPQFTVGEKQMQKQQTIERLTKEGLMELQKELALPTLPYRLAVISSETAAGYGDFTNHLNNNEYGYVFDVTLFQSLMQGEQASESICGAIASIEESEEPFDAVLILRGGGSEADLSCFDDYDMAKAIAQCTVPVITAIGHEKDFHIADMVAHDYVKTPTALADIFINCYLEEDEKISGLEQRLNLAFGSRLAALESHLDNLEARIRPAALSRVTNELHAVEMLETRVKNSAQSRIDGQIHALERISDMITRVVTSRLDSNTNRLDKIQGRVSKAVVLRAAHEEAHIDRSGEWITRVAALRINEEGNRLDKIDNRIRRLVDKILADAASHLMTVETRIFNTDPRRVLLRGFVLALDSNGVKMQSASESKVGDRVQMMFADGTLKCGVVEVDRKSNIPDEGDLDQQEAGA